MRFIGSLVIFLFHVSVVNSPIPPNLTVNPFKDQQAADWFAFVFAQLGYMGVSFFFILTGFIITWSAYPFTESKWLFWKRRIVKIYPNHLVISLLALVLFSWNYTPISTAIKNTLLIHAFFPQSNVYVSVNPPAWSLCVDMLFYLAFPFLIRRLAPLSGRAIWAWIAAVTAVIFAIPLINDALIPNYPKSPITPISADQFWFGYIFPVTRIFDFILGALLARIVMLGLWPRLGILASSCLIIASAVAAKFVPFIYGLNAITIIPIAALICATATADFKGKYLFLLRHKTMQKLGDVSFGFYICQGITIFYLRTLLDGTYSMWASVGLIACSFVLTLFAGWLLYTAIERPAMRRWGRSRREIRPDLKKELDPLKPV